MISARAAQTQAQQSLVRIHLRQPIGDQCAPVAFIAVPREPFDDGLSLPVCAEQGDEQAMLRAAQAIPVDRVQRVRRPHDGQTFIQPETTLGGQPPDHAVEFTRVVRLF